MQSKAQTGATALTPVAPVDQYEATFWQQWRAQLHLVLQKPWLAATWLKQSRSLFQRFNRIYTNLCQQPRPVRRRLQRQLGATLAGAALALALANAPAQAADFTANDQPTLVAAITSANDETTNPGADTITLTDNITLTTAVFTNTVISSDFPVALPPISSTITIEGAGYTIARDSTITESFGIFTVAPIGTMTLNEATISGSQTLFGSIFNLGGVLTVNDSTFTGNSGLFGSAISSKYGTTAINGSTFGNNLAKYGGAISLLTQSGMDASATIADSTITNNISIGWAGGILNNQSLTVTNTLIDQNTAKYGSGGGMMNGFASLPGGTVTIMGSNLTNNVTVGDKSGGGHGGGLYNLNGNVTFTDSTISGNSSGFSGGGLGNIYAPCLAPVATTFAKPTVSPAVAEKLKERGIDSTQLNAWEAQMARFKGLTAKAARAQMCQPATSTMTLVNSTVSNNTAGTNTSTVRTNDDDGGGILNIGGELTLTNSTVSGNRAPNNMGSFRSYGGGIYNDYGGVLTLNHSTMTANSAARTGGGIYNGADSAGMTLSRSIISGNVAPHCAEIENYSSGGTTAPYTVDASNIFGHRSLTNAKAFGCADASFTPGANDLAATSDGTQPKPLSRILNTTLADNGGATFTHALVNDSPAINGAGDGGLDTDQRGAARPQGAADDIGAVEMPIATITIALDARPNLPTDLGFGGNLGGFLLDDPDVDDGDAYTNTRTFNVVPGVYTVRRNNPTGWFTTNIDCVPTSGAATNVPQRSATLTVANGDAVTCTFTVDRAVQITARAFNDIVRNNANLGQRNAADPWLDNWSMSISTSPTATVASGQTAATTIAGLYQINFPNLRPGDYTVCTVLPDGSWTPTTPTALDPNFGKYCKAVTLTPGQIATVLFGAYQGSVVASEKLAPDAELVADVDNIITLPYDPAEDETVTEEDGLLRSFLPIIKR